MCIYSHSTLCLLSFFLLSLHPSIPISPPSPPAESCFLIAMLMTVMMVDCPRLPGGQFGRTATVARCPPITWPSSLSVATRIPSQVCLGVCVCTVSVVPVSRALLQNFLQLLSNVSFCPTFTLLHVGRSNSSPALLDSYTPRLFCVIIMSGRERDRKRKVSVIWLEGVELIWISKPFYCEQVMLPVALNTHTDRWSHLLCVRVSFYRYRFRCVYVCRCTCFFCVFGLFVDAGRRAPYCLCGCLL